MKLERLNRWKKKTIVTLFKCTLNVNNFRTSQDKGFKIGLNPIIMNNLEHKQLELVKYHIDQAIDIINKYGIIELEDLI